MGKYLFRFPVTILILMVFIVGCSNGEPTATSAESGDEVKELKLISFLPINHILTEDIIPMWIDMIEEGLDGDVKIKWIGGPESIPSTDQYNSMKNGMVDINFSVSSMFSNIMPESDSMLLSPHTASEERENGYFDYLGSRFEKDEVQYLGRWIGNQSFYFWSNSEVDSLDELKGLRFRTNPIYHGTMSKLGMVQVDVVPGDIYTSLERKLVDGFGFTLLGPRSDGLTEVTKYVIDEPFLNQNAAIMMNSKTFNSISPDNQKKIIDITAEFEQKMLEYFKEKVTEEWDALEESGIKRIELSEDDSNRFQAIVKEETWKTLGESIDEAVIKELEEYLHN